MQSLSGSERLNGQAAQTAAAFVVGSRDVVERSDHHDAPGHRRLLVILVDLETCGGARTAQELGPWLSAEHNRIVACSIVQRKDPGPALDNNRQAAKFVAAQ